MQVSLWDWITGFHEETPICITPAQNKKNMTFLTNYVFRFYRVFYKNILQTITFSNVNWQVQGPWPAVYHLELHYFMSDYSLPWPLYESICKWIVGELFKVS